MFTNIFFFSHGYIGIFFKLGNCALLIVIALYFFRKYGLSFFSSLLEKKEAEQQTLRDEQLILEKKQLALSILMAEEQAVCQTLQNKVDQWKKMVDSENTQRKKEDEKLYEFMQKKMAFRASQEEQKEMKTQVLTLIIPRLKTSLTCYFKNDAHVSQYTNKIIDYMDRKAQ